MSLKSIQRKMELFIKKLKELREREKIQMLVYNAVFECTKNRRNKTKKYE